MIIAVIYHVFELSSGRVGAINLEQLNTLLSSLKTYWDTSDSIQEILQVDIVNKQVSMYEL